VGEDVLEDGFRPFRDNIVIFDAQTLEELQQLNEVKLDPLGVSM
jgi:hypothetical protein